MTEYAKKLLRLYHEQSKKNRIIEGSLPLNFKGKGKDLKNYRIYGNTVNSESVGDLITEGEHAGEYRVPVTVEGKNEGKNLYEITKFANGSVSQTVSGITFTISNNKVIYSGTSTATYPQVLSPELPLIPGQSYYAKIIVKGSYEGQIYIYFRGSRVEGGTNQNYKQILPGTEEVFTVWYNTCVLYVAQGDTRHFDASVEVVITKVPSVTTPIYLPEPIKMVGDEAEYIDYGEQKLHRVRKNLLQNTTTSRTHNGVTFTVNDDKSITCNGTSTSQYYSYIELPILLLPGQYRLSGCPLNGDTNTYRAELRVNDLTVNGSIDIGNGSIFTVSSETEGLYFIRIQGGYTVENKTFYPMIRKADIEDDTYEPYIENVDVDVTLPALPTISGTNTLSVGTEVQPSKVEIKGKIKAVQEGSGENEGE